jgi:hypothetical protein
MITPRCPDGIPGERGPDNPRSRVTRSRTLSAVSNGHTVALASRTFPRLPRALHTLVEAPGTVALLSGGYEPVRERLAIDVAEEALRARLAIEERPGLDALAAIVRALHDAVDGWVTVSERLDLWQWGASVAIVVVDGPAARIAQLGNVTTSLARGGLLITLGHDHTFGRRVRWPEGAKVPDSLRNVELQTLGVAPRPWISLAQVELAPGDRLVITSDHAASGTSSLDRGALASPAEVLAETIVAAGEADRDRACVVIAIAGPTDGPYR